jgi:hypothetical protein
MVSLILSLFAFYLIFVHRTQFLAIARLKSQLVVGWGAPRGHPFPLTSPSMRVCFLQHVLISLFIPLTGWNPLAYGLSSICLLDLQIWQEIIHNKTNLDSYVTEKYKRNIFSSVKYLNDSGRRESIFFWKECLKEGSFLNS